MCLWMYVVLCDGVHRECVMGFWDLFKGLPREPENAPVATPWLDIAMGELGVSEFPGEQHNPRILEYHQSTSLRATDDETPWCASFVNWVLQKAGIVGTNNAQAKSFMTWGLKLATLRKGAIVVFKRGDKEWQGHVGIVEQWEGKHVWIVSGNHADGVQLAAYPIADILDIRWPKSIYNSTTVKASGGLGASLVVQKLIDDPLIAKGMDLSQNVSTSLHVVLLAVQLALIAWIVSERAKRMMRDGA